MLCRDQADGNVFVRDEPRLCTLRRAMNIVDAAFPNLRKSRKGDAARASLVAAVYDDIRFAETVQDPAGASSR